ncbi:proline-rich protein 4 [Ziziphus jujuba]|uniref:Proline-rich protein 4 n=1 Tax=Ziziphus jujuba TaxID=326968 RepID=A0ABM3IFB2_ZIZJJ|nr:proline-rich protein 4 [Ziziphus jujuba]
MFYLLKIFFFILTFTYLSEARPQKNPSTAVVVGTVYCDTCFQQDFSKDSHFISGASVAVECKDGTSNETSFRKEVKTDNHGEFKVQLPFSIGKHVKKIEGCSVKLISSSEPYCAVASTATKSSLHLKSRKQGIHIFSAGFFTFKPLKQPNLCNQKPSIENSKGLNSNKASLPPVDDLSFPPPIQDPTIPGLPPFQYLPPLPTLPQLPPLPTLPPLPPLLGLPKFPPAQGKTNTESKVPTEKSSQKSQLSDEKVVNPEFFFPVPPILPPLIPNPFQPPPLIPNPFQPPPLIPNPFQPPPAPLLPFPPIPGLTPSPPPPSLPFPFPPIIPFPPTIPRIPGTPPASSSSSKQTP